jgi:hypothetical protein
MNLCFAEIKTHTTPLLRESNAPYRPDCWPVSSELSGSVAQIQKTVHRACKSLEEQIDLRDAQGNPTGERVFLCEPRTCLIIGSLREFCTEHGVNTQRFTSFELYRQNTTSPDIITFDELFERAKCIVEHSDCQSPPDASPPSQTPLSGLGGTIKL